MANGLLARSPTKCAGGGLSVRFLRMILSENRFLLFGIMRVNPAFTMLACVRPQSPALNKIARFQVPNGRWNHATKINRQKRCRHQDRLAQHTVVDPVRPRGSRHAVDRIGWAWLHSRDPLPKRRLQSAFLCHRRRRVVCRRLRFHRVPADAKACRQNKTARAGSAPRGIVRSQLGTAGGGRARAQPLGSARRSDRAPRCCIVHHLRQ